MSGFKKMRSRTLIWICLAGFIGAFGVIGVWQRSRAVAWRVERERVTERQAVGKRTTASQRAGAAIAAEDELVSLRQQHDELVRMQERLARIERAIANEDAKPRPPAAIDPVRRMARNTSGAHGPLVQIAEWRRAGMATPEATLESFMWAATRGETNELVQLLVIDEIERTNIEEIFSQLSDEMRATYGTPEGMLATVLAVQVPPDLTAIGSMDSSKLGNGDIALRTLLERRGMVWKDVVLTFRRVDGRWQLVVPREIVLSAAAAALKATAPLRR